MVLVKFFLKTLNQSLIEHQELGLSFTSDSNDSDEDTTPLKWAVQKRMVHVTAKGM